MLDLVSVAVAAYSASACLSHFSVCEKNACRIGDKCVVEGESAGGHPCLRCVPQQNRIAETLVLDVSCYQEAAVLAAEHCRHPDATDTDGDGLCDRVDPCPHSNPDDADGNGKCDATAAGSDSDGDGVSDSVDICAGANDGVDADSDGTPDGCDPCPRDADIVETLYPDCDGDATYGVTGVPACQLSATNATGVCSDGDAPDGGWSTLEGDDCNDEDPGLNAATAWYPDCDGDGVPSSVATTACDETGADALFDCNNGADPLGGWDIIRGDDLDDDDPGVTTGLSWYPDCDGDGVYGSLPITARDEAHADSLLDCSDAANPDGGWATTAGTDCNDEDATGSVSEPWYPDCDDDGVHSSTATNACGETGANATFNCADSGDPDGGWDSTAGTDCNDEDATGSVSEPWYPDCDDDGVHSGTATTACGHSGASAAFNCADFADPDGGWDATAGTDCNDEDATRSTVEPWYPDCDNDAVHSNTATTACDESGANAVYNCDDGGDPDGGWDTVAGTDCDDENGAVTSVALWYPDCDNDTIYSSAATTACDEDDANALFDCADTADPDGGWSTAAGTDCNNEDGTGSVSEPWYPDCDNDGNHSSVSTTACGVSGANAAFDCMNGADPDGGWDTTEGTDCLDDPLGDASCWIGSDWVYRRKLTVLATQVLGTHTHFPMLVSDTLASWKSTGNGGHVAQDDGGDIVFTDDDGKTRLKHEIEHYVATTGQVVAWVKLPQISSAGDTLLYMYHGNSTGISNQWDPPAVWDDGGSNLFRGVWHLAEGGTGSRADSTQFGNDCATVNYDNDEDAIGKMGRGDHLDGADDGLSCGRNESLNIRNQVTVATWWNAFSPRYADRGKDCWGNGPWKAAYGLYVGGTSSTLSTLGADFMINGKRKDLWNVGTGDVTPGEWKHLVVTFDGADIRGYVNGTLDFTAGGAGTLDDSSDADLTVGLWEDSCKGPPDAILDEIRISSTDRGADWIRTCYNNQSSPGTFLTVGSEVTE